MSTLYGSASLETSRSQDVGSGFGAVCPWVSHLLSLGLSAHLCNRVVAHLFKCFGSMNFRLSVGLVSRSEPWCCHLYNGDKNTLQNCSEDLKMLTIGVKEISYFHPHSNKAGMIIIPVYRCRAKGQRG